MTAPAVPVPSTGGDGPTLRFSPIVRKGPRSAHGSWSRGALRGRIAQQEPDDWTTFMAHTSSSPVQTSARDREQRESMGGRGPSTVAQCRTRAACVLRALQVPLEEPQLAHRGHTPRRIVGPPTATAVRAATVAALTAAGGMGADSPAASPTSAAGTSPLAGALDTTESLSGRGTGGWLRQASAGSKGSTGTRSDPVGKVRTPQSVRTPRSGAVSASPTPTPGGHLSASAGPDTPLSKRSATSERKGEAADAIEAAEALAREVKSKWKMKKEAKQFKAALSSFQELVNAERQPTSIADTVERLKTVCGGKNFEWERNAEWNGGYGSQLSFSFQLILWYQNWDHPDMQTQTSTSITFMHQAGCVYVYQPVVPVTSLMISPRTSYKPMFEKDPRSFHTFKVAWRNLLDFGVSDYRIIVGEQLQRWTERCKAVIEKPLNVVYWLMLMVGSHYRESLVKRQVLKGIEDPPTRVTIICVDSFVALSALLFSPERQILFAGVGPTPSYLEWLQYVADQHGKRKDQRARRKRSTVFEMNEFLDLSVVIVYYGRIQQKVKESMPLSWVGNPALIKSYIAKFMEDNCCEPQLEQAVRLYSYSCALGRKGREDSSSDEPWYCWNGLKVCEIGVPMPSTQASFLSPFTTTKYVALLCPVHGPDAVRAGAKKEKQAASPTGGHGADEGGTNLGDAGGGGGGGVGCRSSGGAMARRPSVVDGHMTPGSRSRHTDPEEDESVSDSSADDESDNGSGRTETMRSLDHASSEDHGEPDSKGKPCSCVRYIKGGNGSKQMSSRRKQPGQSTAPVENLQLMQSLCEYDEMHCFIAILTGGLNLAKVALRLHFSIDTRAYANLPMPHRVNWADSVIPWYREFHRPDAHGRSRYSTLLESAVHGLLGDGYTSGYHDDALDILRISTIDSNTGEPDKELSDAVSLKMKIPEAQQKEQQEQQTAKQQSTLDRKLSKAPETRRRSTMLNAAAVAAAAMGGTGGSKGRRATNRPVESAHGGDSLGHSPTAGAHAHSGGKSERERNLKGVISDIVLWTELYESESLFTHRSHFENFTQWCTSAQMVPFLARCYRRFGVAGLMPGQRNGGHKMGVDPSHPLVLPTVPNFCYGHCYPLHRVLEYFYGGIDNIVCSCDDPHEVEADRAQLGLIAGQERLNNQCWFQPAERDFLVQAVDGHHTHFPSGKLNSKMLEMLEEDLNEAKKRSGAGDPDKLSKAGTRTSSPDGHRSAKGDEPNAETGRLNKRNSNRVVRRTFSKSMVLSSGWAAVGKLKKLGGQRADKARRKFARAQPSVGVLAPDDPFFWFCQQNFALYTFPVTNFARHLLNDIHSLTFRYSDFVSRSGSPEPGRRDPGARGEDYGPDDADLDPEGSKFVPASINLCQPTDTYSNERKRWEVVKEFVDERKLILGDMCWFPGALGYRFTFEVKTFNVDPYVKLSAVPQIQLLYVEHSRVSREERRKQKAETRSRALKVVVGDSDHSSTSEEEPGADRSPGARLRQQKKIEKGAAALMTEQTVSLMLPPLLPSKMYG